MGEGFKELPGHGTWREDMGTSVFQGVSEKFSGECWSFCFGCPCQVLWYLVASAWGKRPFLSLPRSSGHKEPRARDRNRMKLGRIKGPKLALNVPECRGMSPRNPSKSTHALGASMREVSKERQGSDQQLRPALSGLSPGQSWRGA